MSTKQYPAVIGETGCKLLLEIKEEFDLKNSTEAFQVLSEAAKNTRFSSKPQIDPETHEPVKDDDGETIMEAVDRFELQADKVKTARATVKVDKLKERLIRQMFDLDPEAARQLNPELVAQFEAEAVEKAAKAEAKAAKAEAETEAPTEVEG